MAKAAPAISIVVALVVGLLGGYFASTAISPVQQTVTVRSVATQIITSTTTVGGGQPVTVTVTAV
ncbi:MAG: hypothetical protein QXJ73_06100, partial [Candidatus Caldarchaeum sp.]